MKQTRLSWRIVSGVAATALALCASPVMAGNEAEVAEHLIELVKIGRGVHPAGAGVDDGDLGHAHTPSSFIATPWVLGGPNRYLGTAPCQYSSVGHGPVGHRPVGRGPVGRGPVGRGPVAS